MRKFAHAFFQLGTALQYLWDLNAGMEMLTSSGSAEQLANLQPLYEKSLNEAYQCCEICEFDVSKLAIQELRDLQMDFITDEKRIGQQLQEIQSTIRREASSSYFLHLTKTKHDLYIDPAPFGLAVYGCFHSSYFDLSEAGKCLALNRATACVFHLMRALETPLRLLADEIQVPRDDNWNKVLNNFDSMLGRLSAALKQNSADKPADWEDRERFYSGASALLRNVKNAWRNDAMHLERKYTTEEAKEIYDATGGFLKFLATRLREDGTMPL